MSEEWTTTTAGEVQPGDRVRLESGEEVIATRIEAPFMGRDEMVAFIEDTAERWYKRPARSTATVQVQRSGS